MAVTVSDPLPVVGGSSSEKAVVSPAVSAVTKSASRALVVLLAKYVFGPS